MLSSPIYGKETSESFNPIVNQLDCKFNPECGPISSRGKPRKHRGFWGVFLNHSCHSLTLLRLRDGVSLAGTVRSFSGHAATCFRSSMISLSSILMSVSISSNGRGGS